MTTETGISHCHVRRRKPVLFLLVLLCAAAAMLLSQRDTFRPVFAQWSNQSTLVLDAGHGGMDGGATAKDGTAEQDINLAIVRKCRALAGLYGVHTILTRTDEHALDYDPTRTIRANKVADIHKRESITNEAKNPVFLSVHLNQFSDSSYSGAQVFWSKNNPEGQALAEAIQRQLTSCLKPARERTAKQASDSIYLMKNLTCPAVITECGFLSNAEEAQKLQQDAYQTTLALCIMSGYLCYLEND